MTIAVLRVSAGGIAIVRTGENTAEAARQAGIATAKAGEAETFADIAENAAQAALGAANYYTTIAAGVAATPVGSMFTSDEGGNWNYYVRTAGSPFYTMFRSVLAADSSGNVGIGTSSPSEKFVVSANGGGTLAALVSQLDTTSATLAQFKATHGSGSAVTLSAGSGFTLLGNTTAIPMVFGINNTERLRITSGGTVRPGADNNQDLGEASYRWSTVYAGTGTINTSDQRHKVWQEPTEEHADKYRAIARRIFDELGWYQFTASVEEKGPDGARWHFGARAQRVWQIVADEGLAPPLIELDGELLPDLSWQGPVAPAWICFDTWNETFMPEMVDVTITEEVSRQVPTGELDEDGEPIIETITELVERTESQPTGNQIKTRDAGHLFGFRTDQINMLLNWSLHERLAALEANQ